MATIASSAQITEIEQFLTARELHFNEYDRLWAILEAHRIDERCPGDGTPIAAGHAARIMAWLRRNADRDAPQQRPVQVGCRHVADRNGNCVTCGAEMFDTSAGSARSYR
jgi:hypothetical protein